MSKIHTMFAGITAGFILLFTALTPGAQAAPQTAPTASVCETGFRGQPAYDRMCLVTGHYDDARREWKSGYSKAERTAQCRTALRVGMPAVVRETRGDTLFDSYRNYQSMIRLTALAGAAECFRL